MLTRLKGLHSDQSAKLCGLLKLLGEGHDSFSIVKHKKLFIHVHEAFTATDAHCVIIIFFYNIFVSLLLQVSPIISFIMYSIRLEEKLCAFEVFPILIHYRLLRYLPSSPYAPTYFKLLGGLFRADALATVKTEFIRWEFPHAHNVTAEHQFVTTKLRTCTCWRWVLRSSISVASNEWKCNQS